MTDDIDKNIADCRRNYENINNDMFEEARQRLEVFLFRLYQWKYFIAKYEADADCRKFLTDDKYYDILVQKIEKKMNPEEGLTFLKKALEYVQNKDYEEAGRYFYKGALCGDRNAQYNYGVTVTNGEGCEEDPLEGAFWYWMAANKGNAKAMVNLAIDYRNGDGVKESGIQMLYWYARSAYAADLPYGVYNLGLTLKHEEVLEGNSWVGRMLVEASEHLDNEEVQEFVKKISGQVIEIISDNVYNVFHFTLWEENVEDVPEKKKHFDDSVSFDEEQIFNINSDFYLFSEQDKVYLQKYLNDIMYDLVCAMKDCEHSENTVSDERRRYLITTYCHIVTIIDFAAAGSIPVQQEKEETKQQELMLLIAQLYLDHIGNKEFYTKLSTLTGIDDKDFRQSCHMNFQENIVNTIFSIWQDYPDFLSEE